MFGKRDQIQTIQPGPSLCQWVKVTSPIYPGKNYFNLLRCNKHQHTVGQMNIHTVLQMDRREIQAYLTIKIIQILRMTDRWKTDG